MTPVTDHFHPAVPAASHPFFRNASLEITAKDAARLAEVAPALPAGMPISITFLPKNTIEQLVEVASAVRRLGFTPVPHISARRIRSAADLESLLRGLQSGAQIDRVFIIGGDPDQAFGPYDSALDIINTDLLATFGVRQVGIAGYPEGHPLIGDTVLRRALADKLEALGQRGHTAEIVTQFVFDPNAALDWLATIRAEGIDIPVRIGIPGPASVKSLIGYAAKCGVTASTKVLAKYGISLGRLLSTATPDRLVGEITRQLDRDGDTSVHAHLYPFGGLSQSVQWLAGCAPAQIDAAARQVNSPQARS